MTREPVNNSGSFAEISCPRLLVHLHLAGFTGTLRISQGAVLKLLYFQTGEIAMASSNDQGDHLAPILMRAGKLKAEQLELARKQARPGTSLARVLVQMGFLTSGELFSGARQQLRQIVGSVLANTEGSYEIQSDYFPREVTSLNVDTRELLLDLILDLPERSFVLLEVGAPDTSYFPAGALLAGAAPPRLTKKWQEYAGCFAGSMTIHAFGQAAGLDDFAASKAVYGLHLLGLLETAATEPEEAILPIGAGPQPEDTDIVLDSEPGALPVAEEIPEHGDESPGPALSPEGEDVDRGEAGAEIATAPGEAPLEPTPPAGATEPEAESKPSPPSWLSAGEGGKGEEIVAQGEPIRLEFRGPWSSQPAPRRSSAPWGILSILAGIAILVASFAWFVFLRDASAPAAISPVPSRAEERAPGSVPVEAAPSDASGERETGPETGGTETVVPDRTAPAKAAPPAEIQAAAPPSVAGPAGPGEEAAAVPAAREGPASPPAPEPRPRTADVSGDLPAQGPAPSGGPAAPSPAAGKVSAAPPFAAADRFLEARSLLDSGDLAGAGDLWLETARQETKKGFTLQIAIACQEESVKKAARRTRGSVDFFTVPFSLQGKPCYRLCWGAYASQEEAQAAKISVPAFFLDEGGKPVVVGLGKLVPPERR